MYKLSGDKLKDFLRNTLEIREEEMDAMYVTFQ